MSCMKHVGFNVAADPTYTVSYMGVNGGLVIVVADDPGLYSSQNEQDTRMVACGTAPCYRAFRQFRSKRIYQSSI